EVVEVGGGAVVGGDDPPGGAQARAAGGRAVPVEGDVDALVGDPALDQGGVVRGLEQGAGPVEDAVGAAAVVGAGLDDEVELLAVAQDADLTPTAGERALDLPDRGDRDAARPQDEVAGLPAAGEGGEAEDGQHLPTQRVVALELGGGLG